MKKQSIANRNSLNKIKEENPEKFEDIKRARRVSSALSVLRLNATKKELQKAKSEIEIVLEFLSQHSDKTPKELKELRAQTFGRKPGRPKQK